jgi:hypothetical protein
MKFVKSIIVAAFLINPISSLAFSIDEQKIKVTTDRACELFQKHWMKLAVVYCFYMISKHTKDISQQTKEIAEVNKNTNPTLAATVTAQGESLAQLQKDNLAFATKTDLDAERVNFTGELAKKADKEELKNFILADKFTAVETLTNQHAELLKIKSATPTTEKKQ